MRFRGSVQPRCSTVAVTTAAAAAAAVAVATTSPSRNVTFDGVNRFKIEGSGCPFIFQHSFASLPASDDVFVFSFAVLLWASNDSLDNLVSETVFLSRDYCSSPPVQARLKVVRVVIWVNGSGNASSMRTC